MSTTSSGSESSDLTEQEENSLLERLKADDDAAYAEAVRRYGPRLLVVTRRLLGQEQDAQDAVQDAFLSAFRGIQNFQGDARLSTWLHRIAVNASLMKLRTKRRRPETAIEDLLPKFREDGHRVQDRGPWMMTLDYAVQQREVQEQVRLAIDRLPEAYKEVLTLRDIEGLSTEETAQRLGVTDGAVKTRLHRARLALRELLDKFMRGEEDS